jgi:hypothetical protein
VAKTPRDPFDVPLSSDQRKFLGIWLGNELRNADASRAAEVVDIDYWWSLYEQARTRGQSNLPWPDAADLTSYIPAEKVDAIQARIMRTVFVTPICTVEGWGSAADKAPFVEEFHQWKTEEERLQGVLDKVSLAALVEPRCLLEVYESTQRRTIRKQIAAKPTMTPQGGVLFDEQGQPHLETDPQTGEYQQAESSDLAVNVVIDSEEPVRSGPSYRVLPYEDSLILPGHARDKQEIWGYAKRFWKRKIELLSDVDAGIYDKDAVEGLTDTGDRGASFSLIRSRSAVSPQGDRETAEKELWEALILVDLNDLLEQHHQEPMRGSAFSGQRWYVVTIHLLTNTILRVNHDDLERSRYIPFILFPRPNRATEGYSLVGHKLLTITEEHTAYRNMAADRSSMAVNAPIKKTAGALWDEDEQPWGPKAVITVRDQREIEQVQVADVPASVYQQITYCDRTADRLAGVNDIASGQVEQESRTLGEIQMATEQSFVRMDLIVRRFQECVEDLFQVRHAIWKRCLAESPNGVDAPESMMAGLEGRGVPIDAYLPNGKVMGALLEGSFRFRPYGSVETADPAKRRNDLLGLLATLPNLMKVFPQLIPMFQTPQAARAIFRELLQAFRVHNTQAFLGSPSQDMSQQMGMPGMLPPAMPQGMQPMAQQAQMTMPGMPQGGGPPQFAPAPMLPSPFAPGPTGVQ